MDIFISRAYNNGKNLKFNAMSEVITITSENLKRSIFTIGEYIKN